MSEGKVGRDGYMSVVCCAYAIVSSSKFDSMFVEKLAEAVKRNFRSFREAAGEDWLIIGIFADHETAYKAMLNWWRPPGAQRRDELGAGE